MVSIHALWLPILLSSVIVFFASSLIHMIVPFHRSDYRKLPDEERLLDVMRSTAVTPGRVYIFPFTSHRDMKSPEAIEKFNRGPVGMLTIRPSGAPNMGQVPWPVVRLPRDRKHFRRIPHRTRAPAGH